jgi:small subunit ribosomal protein S9
MCTRPHEQRAAIGAFESDLGPGPEWACCPHVTFTGGVCHGTGGKSLPYLSPPSRSCYLPHRCRTCSLSMATQTLVLNAIRRPPWSASTHRYLTTTVVRLVPRRFPPPASFDPSLARDATQKNSGDGEATQGRGKKKYRSDKDEPTEAELRHQDELDKMNPFKKAKPELSGFYTLASDYYDQMDELKKATQTARKTLTLLELYPLPRFARKALPPTYSFWKNRRDLSALFDEEKLLPTRHYAEVTKLLNELNTYQNIARTAGHTEVADSIASVLRIFERPDKEALLGRGNRVLARLDRYGRTYSVGRRKTSSAQVWIIPTIQPRVKAKTAAEIEADAAAKAAAERAALEAELFHGKKSEEVQVEEAPLPTASAILVNGRPLRDVFPTSIERERVLRPLKIAGVLGAYNVFAISRGGGTTGQSDAIALAIAKGLTIHVPEMKASLKKGMWHAC